MNNECESCGSPTVCKKCGGGVYKIVRMYERRENELIKRFDTLEEAQKHCNDPETSSSTCTLPEMLEHTIEHGPWFDGYTGGTDG